MLSIVNNRLKFKEGGLSYTLFEIKKNRCLFVGMKALGEICSNHPVYQNLGNAFQYGDPIDHHHADHAS